MLVLAPSAAPAAPPAALARLAGQSVMTGFSGTTAPAALLGRIRRGEVGGVVLYHGNVASTAQLRVLVGRLQQAAADGGNPPLLVAVDQEGGPVRRVPGPPVLSAAAMAARGPAFVDQQGLAAGKALRADGVDVDLAPVADVPDSPASFLGTRAFGRSTPLVSAAAGAFAAGLQTAQVAATAKHFPGLGTARANTDLARVEIRTPRAGLERRLPPFAGLVQGGVRLVMVSNAGYPALDGSGQPAVFSPTIVTGLLRGKLGFAGVAISDSLDTPAAQATPHPAARALRAGVDVVLYVSERSSAQAYADLVAQARRSAGLRTALRHSAARIATLKAWLA